MRKEKDKLFSLSLDTGENGEMWGHYYPLLQFVGSEELVLSAVEVLIRKAQAYQFEVKRTEILSGGFSIEVIKPSLEDNLDKLSARIMACNTDTNVYDCWWMYVSKIIVKPWESPVVNDFDAVIEVLKGSKLLTGADTQ